MRGLERRADAQSKETTFSGLPKIAKMISTFTQTPGASAWNFLIFTDIVFNYGGFGANRAAAPPPDLYNGWVAREAGVHMLNGQGCFAPFGGNTAVMAQFFVNGSITGLFTSAGADYSNPAGGAAVVGGGFNGGVWNVSTYLELRAGDSVQLGVINNAGGTNTVPSYSHLVIHKLPGQY